MQQPRQKLRLSQKQKLHSFREKALSIPSTTRTQQITKLSQIPYSSSQITPKGANSNRQQLKQQGDRKQSVELLYEGDLKSPTPQVGVRQISSSRNSLTPKRKKQKQNAQQTKTSKSPSPATMERRSGSPQNSLMPSTLEQIYLGKSQKIEQAKSKTSFNNPFLSLKKLQSDKKKKQIFKFAEDSKLSHIFEVQQLRIQNQQLWKDLLAAQKMQQMYRKSMQVLEQKNVTIKQLKVELQQEYKRVKKLRQIASEIQSEQSSQELSLKQELQGNYSQTQKRKKAFSVLEGGSESVANGLNQLGERFVSFLDKICNGNKRLMKENKKLSSVLQ